MGVGAPGGQGLVGHGQGLGGAEGGGHIEVEAADQGVRAAGDDATAHVDDGLALEHPHALVELVHADMGLAGGLLEDVLGGEAGVPVQAQLEDAGVQVAAGLVGDGVVRGAGGEGRHHQQGGGGEAKGETGRHGDLQGA